MEFITDLKKRLTGLSVFFIFLLTIIFQKIFFKILSKTIFRDYYSLFTSLFLVITIIFIYRNILKSNYKDLKQNHKKYFSKCLKYWLIALFFMILTNIILIFYLKNDIPVNEQTVRDIFNINPISTYISAIIIAPFLEELVFRQAFRDMFRNNFLFILISSFVFGLFHIIGEELSLINLLYLIPYMIPAIAFSIMLKKTNNVLVPIGFHLLHNGISISLQVILLIFG